MLESYDFGAGCEEGGEGGEVEGSVGDVEGYVFEYGVLFLGEHLPGNDVGVVFEFGDEDLVTRLDVGASVCGGDEVEGFGGSGGEYYFVAGGGVDERGYFVACALVFFGCLAGEGVCSAVDVGVGSVVVGC